MKSEWKSCQLYEVADIVDSLHKTPQYTECGIPMLRVTDIKEGYLSLRSPAKVSPETYDEFTKKHRPKQGDVVVSRVGTYGVFAYVATKDKFCLGQNTAIIIPHINEKFLYYSLISAGTKKYLNKIVTGSTQKTISLKNIKAIPLSVPNDTIQERIADILSALDDKIELNNKINENLERQAATLFDNFYNRANSRIGFTEIIQILGGGTPKTGESSYWNGVIPFFTPKDVGSPYALLTEKWITEEGLSHCNSRLYPANTVFVTARGTVGKVGLAGVPMAMNQSCYALVGKEIHQLLVYFYTLKAVERLKHKASGAVFDAITTRDFESESISKLSNDDAKTFLSIAEPIYQAILSNAMENQRLATLRDTLLPKLMSGEIDVSDIQL